MPADEPVLLVPGLSGIAISATTDHSLRVTRADGSIVTVSARGAVTPVVDGSTVDEAPLPVACKDLAPPILAWAVDVDGRVTVAHGDPPRLASVDVSGRVIEGQRVPHLRAMAYGNGGGLPPQELYLLEDQDLSVMEPHWK